MGQQHDYAAAEQNVVPLRRTICSLMPFRPQTRVMHFFVCKMDYLTSTTSWMMWLDLHFVIIASKWAFGTFLSRSLSIWAAAEVFLAFSRGTPNFILISYVFWCQNKSQTKVPAIWSWILTNFPLLLLFWIFQNKDNWIKTIIDRIKRDSDINLQMEVDKTNFNNQNNKKIDTNAIDDVFEFVNPLRAWFLREYQLKSSRIQENSRAQAKNYVFKEY